MTSSPKKLLAGWARNWGNVRRTKKPNAGSSDGTSDCADKLLCPVRNMQGKPFLIPCCDSEESWKRLTAKELSALISEELHVLQQRQQPQTATTGYAMPIPPSMIALVNADSGDVLENDALVSEYVSPMAADRAKEACDSDEEEEGADAGQNSLPFIVKHLADLADSSDEVLAEEFLNVIGYHDDERLGGYGDDEDCWQQRDCFLSCEEIAAFSRAHEILFHVRCADKFESIISLHSTEIRTPLIVFCAGMGYGEVVRLLLRAGADVNLTDEEGDTAVSAAVCAGEPEVMRMLLDAGVDANGSGLAWAAERGDSDLARVLLDAGADANGSDRFGMPALLWAASEGHSEIVRLLLDAGASVNAACNGNVDMYNCILPDGSTALIFAASRGGITGTQIVRLLLDAGADVNAACKGGGTALLCAARGGDSEIVRLLLDAGADTRAVDENGDTALALATRRDHTEVVQLLTSGAGKGSASRG